MGKNHTVRHSLFFLCILTGLELVLLLGCGPRASSYGVILWSPEEQIVETGSVVPIYEESRIKKTYMIGVATQKAPFELPVWRVRSFRSRKEAEAFASQFEPVRYLYAISERRALPIREKPDRLSRQVYRLRQDEMIKILQLGTEPADENGLQGHWHRVLTQDGTEGYCFDYYLTLYDGKTQAKLTVTHDPAEEKIAHLLSTSWKPLYFQTMVNQNRIDLDRFKTEYGLSISLDPPMVRILLPDTRKEIPFTTLTPGPRNRFLLEGSSASLSLNDTQQVLTLTYTDKNEQRSAQFIAFDGDIEEIIQKEKERRKQLLSSLLEHGHTLKSSGFGEITLNEDGTFQWRDFDKLIPTVVSSEVKGSGRIEFSTFPDSSLEGKFDGSITFRFDAEKAGRNIATFLYRFTEGGVQFVHIPQSLIQENMIRRLPTTPLILYFSFS